MDDIMNAKIGKLTREIEAYKQAISDTQNALAAAERELDEELSCSVEENSPIYIW